MVRGKAGDAGTKCGAAALTRRIGIPVAALLVVGLLSILFLLVEAARGRDEVAIAASQHMARSAISALERQLGGIVRDYAEWDEAMENLHVTLNQEWAGANIGTYVYDTFGITDILVIGPGERLVFYYSRAGEGDAPSLEPIGESLRALIRAARLASLEDPPVTGFVSIAGSTHVSAAKRLSYFDPSKTTPEGESSVLVFARNINQQLLAELSQDNLLPGLRFARTEEIAERELKLPLPMFGENAPLGYLIWHPELPGVALVRVLIAPIGGAMAVMVALLGVILVNARRAGLALDAATAQLRAAREDLEIKVAERTAELKAEVQERRHAEAAVRQAEARYRSIFENAAEGIFQMAPDGRFLSANPAMARMLGFDSADNLIASKAYGLLMDPIRRIEFQSSIDSFGVVQNFTNEARRQDGSVIWVSQSTRAVRDDDGQIVYYEGMVVDITERKRAEERLIHDALYDGLTGLPNRTLFLERLGQALARGQRSKNLTPSFALLFIDCDRFKLINDSLGHLAGDNLLIALGQRMASCLRRTDTLARLGGDEFAILIEDMAMPTHALILAERLHDVFHRPIILDDQEIFISISIGIALGDREYGGPNEILRDADTAMFQAKAKGRGTTVLFEKGMHLTVLTRLQIETELRRALQRGELCLHYQPIVALAEGTIAGFEALVRWQHNERGLVLPDQFIPVAEETGLIGPLGEKVVEEACQCLANWQQAFRLSPNSLFISVNLSPTQLNQPDLVERIVMVLNKTNLPGECLKLEITETAMMSNPVEVQAKVTALNRLGIKFCVDDFGIGYSSLSQLHTFPFDTVKIDRSFVARLNAGKEHVEIVRTILLLGHNLHLAVVAEGVETPMQSDWLRAAGCAFAQGFFFSTPVDAAAAEAMLRDERKDWRSTACRA